MVKNCQMRLNTTKKGFWQTLVTSLFTSGETSTFKKKSLFSWSKDNFMLRWQLIKLSQNLGDPRI